MVNQIIYILCFLQECTRRTFGEYLSMNAHMLHNEDSTYQIRDSELFPNLDVHILVDHMITERLYRSDVRHGTSNNVPCLCLQVEHWLQDGKEQN